VIGLDAGSALVDYSINHVEAESTTTMPL